jgi:hypothetical protein
VSCVTSTRLSCILRANFSMPLLSLRSLASKYFWNHRFVYETIRRRGLLSRREQDGSNPHQVLLSSSCFSIPNRDREPLHDPRTPRLASNAQQVATQSYHTSPPFPRFSRALTNNPRTLSVSLLSKNSNTRSILPSAPTSKINTYSPLYSHPPS